MTKSLDSIANRRWPQLLGAILFLSFLTDRTQCEETNTVATARADLARRGESQEQEHALAIHGQDDWFFVPRELAHYGSPPGYWKTAATTPNAVSPFDAIISFRDNLAAANIDLILVPVPGKVVLFHEKLDPPLSVPQKTRLDIEDVVFYAELRKHGIIVVDLEPAFDQLNRQGKEPFCHQDSHYSPLGQLAAAQAVAALITARPWYSEAGKLQVETTINEVEVNGDLARLAGPPLPHAEKLSVRQVLVHGAFADAPEAAAQRRAGPIVLIGDSHCLVYGDSTDLLADHADFGSQITAETGLWVDVLANRGSGINIPRLELMRRKDNLAGKKCVIWLFTARLFTQTNETWKVLKVIR